MTSRNTPPPGNGSPAYVSSAFRLGAAFQCGGPPLDNEFTRSHGIADVGAPRLLFRHLGMVMQ